MGCLKEQHGAVYLSAVVAVVKEPGRFVQSPDAITVIAEAGRMFREISPQDDVELLGFVTRLDRDPAQPGGRVTVHALLEEGPRKVHVVETGETGITAHSSRRRAGNDRSLSVDHLLIPQYLLLPSELSGAAE
jgi:hypothetical protein